MILRKRYDAIKMPMGRRFDEIQTTRQGKEYKKEKAKCSKKSSNKKKRLKSERIILTRPSFSSCNSLKFKVMPGSLWTWNRDGMIYI